MGDRQAQITVPECNVAHIRYVGILGAIMVTKKIGRDAETGKFMPVAEAQKHKKTAVVETIKVKTPPPKKKK